MRLKEGRNLKCKSPVEERKLAFSLVLPHGKGTYQGYLEELIMLNSSTRTSKSFFHCACMHTHRAFSCTNTWRVEILQMQIGVPAT